MKYSFWQCERRYVVAGVRVNERVTPGGDYDELPTTKLIRHRHGKGTGRQARAPQFLTAKYIKGPDAVILRGTDKRQATSCDNWAAETRRAPFERNRKRHQRIEHTKRALPENLAGL